MSRSSMNTGRRSMPSSLQELTAETISDALENANLFPEIMTFIKKRCVNYGVDSGTVYSSQDPVVLRKVKRKFEDGWPVTACLMKLFEVAPVVHKEDNNDYRDSGKTAVSPKLRNNASGMNNHHGRVTNTTHQVGPFGIRSSLNGSAYRPATATGTPPSGPPAPPTVKALLSSCVPRRDVELSSSSPLSASNTWTIYTYSLGWTRATPGCVKCGRRET
ncbi:hypothetical protein LXA43DRAFT_576066 [Ganoderma leucocontextum]|nr:hypothetical protein LXA43DRAFT_576066 [Ganoderma leucocontextum]